MKFKDGTNLEKGMILKCRAAIGDRVSYSFYKILNIRAIDEYNVAYIPRVLLELRELRSDKVECKSDKPIIGLIGYMTRNPFNRFTDTFMHDEMLEYFPYTLLTATDEVLDDPFMTPFMATYNIDYNHREIEKFYTTSIDGQQLTLTPGSTAKAYDETRVLSLYKDWKEKKGFFENA